MKLIFIYGMPATGKLTVAQDLAALTGYKLFHNHLTVDLLLSIFDFGSAPFVALREEIWLSVFREACRSGLPGLIFTFAPEPTVRPGFPSEAVKIVHAEGGEVVFVELICPIAELKRRLDSPSRRSFKKLTVLALFESLHEQGSFSSQGMPQPALRIDTSLTEPSVAANTIAATLNLLP